MTQRRKPILLRRSHFGGEVVAITNYQRNRNGAIRVANNGKHNVTGDFNDLLWETLCMAGGKLDADGVEDIDSPDIIKALDYAVQLMLEKQEGDHEALSLASQADAFRKRLIAIANEHNERCESQNTPDPDRW
jgi:hypothetical protein